MLEFSETINDANYRKGSSIYHQKKYELYIKEFPDSQDIALSYAMTCNLSIKQTEVEEKLQTAQKIKDIYKKFNEAQGIALQYARALVTLSAKKTEKLMKSLGLLRN